MCQLQVTLHRFEPALHISHLVCLTGLSEEYPFRPSQSVRKLKLCEEVRRNSSGIWDAALPRAEAVKASIDRTPSDSPVPNFIRTLDCESLDCSETKKRVVEGASCFSSRRC